MRSVSSDFAKHFQVLSTVDLDFVIGERLGWPVGMSQRSPPEFRRRIAAAAISYQLRLRSLDYAMKRYVDRRLYESSDLTLGDEVSDFVRDSCFILEDELKALQTPEPSFGVFGAEFTLFKIPHAIDTARMLANRGLLLEVLPILRLSLEMSAWASVAFDFDRRRRCYQSKGTKLCITSEADLRDRR